MLYEKVLLAYNYCSCSNKQIFETIRSSQPQQLKKLVCISGDIAQPMLGLNEKDMQSLLETVNIIFHSAATVRFDQQLNVAVNLNALGSQRLFSLCMKMPQLKVNLLTLLLKWCEARRPYLNYTSILVIYRVSFMYLLHFLILTGKWSRKSCIRLSCHLV